MHKIHVIILMGCSLFYQTMVYADSDMFRVFVEEDEYRHYKVKGYNLQPDLPEWWYRECGNANHHCVGIHVPQGQYPSTPFKEPSILIEHH